jgi:flavin reductase (DIM6/NTAB) family NADH-FMN oxidoreductase RutF
MERRPIDIKSFAVKPYSFYEVDWLLLTCGDFSAQAYNAMTISWGSIGVMWGRPFAQVVVRPVRYTYEFMERYDSFTLCAFPARYHKALSMLGTKSGRDCDKIAEAGLSATASRIVAAPGYAEAGLIIECRKIYWQDMDPAHFLDAELAKNYPRKDYHRIYYGEIVAVEGLEQYGAAE